MRAIACGFSIGNNTLHKETEYFFYIKYNNFIVIHSCLLIKKLIFVNSKYLCYFVQVIILCAFRKNLK